MKPAQILFFLFLPGMASTAANAQTKEETLAWVKSKLVNYALPGQGKVLNICFSSERGEMGIEYQEGSLVVDNLHKLNCSTLTWVMDDNGPGTGSLQITGSGTGSVKYDCFWQDYPVDDSLEIDFDGAKVWVVNPTGSSTRFCQQTERTFAKFVFNKDFFTDPDLKARFEKAIKHLIVLCGGNGDDKEPF